MPVVRAREDEGCSYSSSEDEPLVFKRTRTVLQTSHYRNPTSIIIQSTIETRGEENAQSEEADGEQEVEEGQQSEENDEDQEEVDDLNVEAEGEQDHLISDLEAEDGQQSEEHEVYQEDVHDSSVEAQGEPDHYFSQQEVEEGQQSEEDQEDDDELSVGVEGEQDYHQSEEEVEEGQQSEEHEVDQEDVHDSSVEAQGEQYHYHSQQEVEEGQQSEEVYDDLNVDEELNNGLLHVRDQEGHISTSASREGSNIVITLTDPGLLDCPICCEPLTIPVFQCDQNGHIACSSCCTKINNKCPFCSCPIGSNRCRAIENVVESSTTPCQNSKYGCNIPVAYNKKYEHENACVYSPCSCPQVGCKFVSSTKELYQHFRNEHRILAMSIRFDSSGGQFNCQITLQKSDNFRFFQERCSGTLFILHNRIEVLGNVVTVSCIQPSFMEDFNYQLVVRNYETTLKFLSVTKNTPSLQVDGPSASATSFLLIPCEFFNPFGQVEINVSIWCK